MRMVVLLLLLAASLLAGCASPPGPAPDAGPARSPEPTPGIEGPVPEPGEAVPSGPLWRRAGCDQLHGIFAFAGGGDWGLPEGFEPQSMEGAGLSQAVFVYPTACHSEGGTGGQETWILLGVEPPEEHHDPTVDLEYWVLGVVLSNDTTLALLHEAGFPVHAGSTSLTGSQNGEVWDVETRDGATYALTSVRGEPTGDDFKVVQRMWADGPDGPHALRIVIDESTDGGMGTATFTSRGDAEAPPAFAGMGHRITAMSYEAVWDSHTLDV